MVLLFSACDQFQFPDSGSKTTTLEKKRKDALKFDNISIQYPASYRDTMITDDFHGKKVTDAYRWLEDENLESTKAWVKNQNLVTYGYLDQIPYRDAIETRLEEIWDYERYSPLIRKGENYYFFRNDGLQNQAVLYAQKGLNGEASVVLDPNRFSIDGTSSLGEYAFSKDGRYLAYQVSEGGSDWRTIQIKDLQSGANLSDVIRWVKFSGISWYKDGFYYSRYPEPLNGEDLSGKNEFHQVYYHKIATPQSQDEAVFMDRSHSQRNFGAETTEDERFLILSMTESTSGNALYFRDLNSDSYEFTPVVETFDADFELVDNQGEHLLVLTNHKAPNKRLVRISVHNPEEGYWEDVIAEGTDVLESVHVFNNKLLALYLHNASSQMKIFEINGREVWEIELPGIGTVTDIKGGKEDSLAYYAFTSFVQPTSIYQLDLDKLSSQVYRSPKLKFEPGDYETKQVWYNSYDGTKIPMFIIHKKGLQKDGRRPSLLYGYGGFDIPVKPIFNRTRLNMFPIILENGGVCAVANIRGGGEFGKKWHEAGTKDKKQNVFDDFQAAAEYLIEQKYTSSEKLAIYGRSNGGLLVGACLTQRPDLYAVALPAVGVLDMLRYHKFTIGWAWATDYGRSDDSKAFDYLISYSPLHNVVPDRYPATLVTTADHDDRVVPAHSFKFSSELQYNQRSGKPVLIRIDTSAGHGAGKPTSKAIEEAADVLAFLFYNIKEDVIYKY